MLLLLVLVGVGVVICCPDFVLDLLAPELTTKHVYPDLAKICDPGDESFAECARSYHNYMRTHCAPGESFDMCAARQSYENTVWW